MYNNIVIAYDDSEFSKAALLESSCWIKRHGGKAILVHSVFLDEEEFALSRTRGSNVLNSEKSCVIKSESMYRRSSDGRQPRIHDL